MTTAEEWRPIPGWEGIYEVSSHGRVYSARRFRARGGLLIPNIYDGYPRVLLCDRSRQVRVRVHQLVALAFLGPPEGRHVRHLDGDPDNNHIDNLAYGWHRENTLDTVDHGRHNNARKTECRHGHSLEDPANVSLRWRPRTLGYERVCLSCRREQSVRYRARQRATS
jgi:hypothetical protein